MPSFFFQYFFKDNPTYSVIIENDGKVTYGYLLCDQDIVGDVWLYNEEVSPEKPLWDQKENFPFLNPLPYVYERSQKYVINSKNDISISWSKNESILRASIFIHNELIGVLERGIKPGWAKHAKKNGPLAKTFKNLKTLNIM